MTATERRPVFGCGVFIWRSVGMDNWFTNQPVAGKKTTVAGIIGVTFLNGSLSNIV
jgi:hypothetical protein